MSRARSSLGSRSGMEDGNAERRKSHASHIGQVAEANEEDADVGNGKHCCMLHQYRWTLLTSGQLAFREE